MEATHVSLTPDFSKLRWSRPTWRNEGDGSGGVNTTTTTTTTTTTRSKGGKKTSNQTAISPFSFFFLLRRTLVFSLCGLSLSLCFAQIDIQARDRFAFENVLSFVRCLTLNTKRGGITGSLFFFFFKRWRKGFKCKHFFFLFGIVPLGCHLVVCLLVFPLSRFALFLPSLFSFSFHLYS